MYRIAFVGLGSIGRRHLKNIYQVLQARNIEFEIDALRNSHSELPENIREKICKEYFEVGSLPDHYDIIFITNPTACHYSILRDVIHKGKHFFIEKPIFETDTYDIDTLELNSNNIYYVACPLRYKACLEYVKKEIENGLKVISARAISSSYLPEWRPNTDYRKGYSAIKALGGGVSLDLIHEWDYITYFWGMPEKMINYLGHFSDLEIDSDDLSIYIAKYADKLVEVHLDYVGRKTERRLELLTNEKRIDVDIVENKIYIYENRSINEIVFPTEDSYIKEMQHFLDCIEGKADNTNTLQHANEVLKLILRGQKK